MEIEGASGMDIFVVISDSITINLLSGLLQAGVDGSRTHRGPQRDPPPVLKTGEPTRTQPLPELGGLYLRKKTQATIVRFP